MATQFDDAFYARAATHINLSNEQKKDASPDMVNASMLFASARFCAWLSAGGYGTKAGMEAGKKEITEFFVKGFREMLEGNIDDYIKNYDTYMKPLP